MGRLTSCPNNLNRTCTGVKTTIQWNPGTTCGDLANSITYTKTSSMTSYSLTKGFLCNPNTPNGVTYSKTGAPCTSSSTFTLDFPSPAGGGTGLTCHYSSGGLPVTLSTFSLKTNKNNINLQWRTEAELENAGFEIQRSSNSRGWETIAFIEGVGSTIEATDYTYTDEKPLKGIQYYRLNQVDYDGKSTFSKVITAKFQSIAQVSVYPNPAKDNLFIDIADIDTQTATIFDNLGRKVLATTLNGNRINITSLDAGIYFVQVTNGNRIEKIRFIKA